jgi:hypothetical protein
VGRTEAEEQSMNKYTVIYQNAIGHRFGQYITLMARVENADIRAIAEEYQPLFIFEGWPKMEGETGEPTATPFEEEQ